MKKLFLSLSLILASVSSALSMNLKEAFQEIEQLPDLNGVISEKETIKDGWLDAIPVQKAEVVVKAHEVNQQTGYYGSHILQTVGKLPVNQLLLTDQNEQNLFYLYASPIDNENSEILLIVDQAYQGKTVAVYGTINNNVAKALQNGEVSITDSHKIIVTAPVLICR